MKRKMQFRSATSPQQGAVLITALVFLTILTILAIASMTTTTLEEKMSSNAQERSRAFQIAEIGLSLAFDGGTTFDTSNSVDDNGTPFDPSDDTYDFSGEYEMIRDETDPGDYSAETTYAHYFVQDTNPPRGSGWPVDAYQAYHFSLISNGDTDSGASVTVHSGAYQIAPKL